MKKVITILLMAVFSVSLCACGGNGASESQKETETIIEDQTILSEEEIEQQETAKETVKPVSSENIDSVLQGTWEVNGGQTIFDNGTVKFPTGETVLAGTYVINMSDSTIDATVKVTDGTLEIHMPFEYNDGVLRIWNNKGVELKKTSSEEAKTNNTGEEQKEEAFIGTWVCLYKDIIEEDLVYNKYGTFGGPDWDVYDERCEKIKTDDLYISKSSVIEDDDTLKINGETYKITDDHGITVLVSENGNSYVKKEEYQKAYNNRFVKVTLDGDNIGDYIGEPVMIGDALDEWNDWCGDLYIMTSPAYENGLIMITYKDVQYEVEYDTGSFTMYEPYGTLTGTGTPVFYGFGRAKGDIIYVKSEYVKSVSKGPLIIYNDIYAQGRTIEFIDGFTFDFFVTGWGNTNASIDDVNY